MSVSKFNRAKVGTKDELEEIANKSHQRIFIGTRDAAELAIQNGEIGDSSVVYITDDYIENSGKDLPIGTIVLCYRQEAPEGYIICDGRSFNTLHFPDLYNYLGKSTVPNFTDNFIYESTLPYEKGIKVVTKGGIYGVISSVKDQTVIIKVDDNCKLEINKSAISKSIPTEAMGNTENVIMTKAIYIIKAK